MSAVWRNTRCKSGTLSAEVDDDLESPGTGDATNPIVGPIGSVGDSTRPLNSTVRRIRPKSIPSDSSGGHVAMRPSISSWPVTAASDSRPVHGFERRRVSRRHSTTLPEWMPQAPARTSRRASVTFLPMQSTKLPRNVDRGCTTSQRFNRVSPLIHQHTAWRSVNHEGSVLGWLRVDAVFGRLAFVSPACGRVTFDTGCSSGWTLLVTAAENGR
jgi:hypothetical protein